MWIRLKILSGFMIIALMLVISGYWSINGFRGIGHSVNAILSENYQSIRASQSMIEALEREDSGVLLLLLGQWEHGRRELNAGDSTFRSLMSFTNTNITLEGERKVLQQISKKYEVYRSILKRPIVGTAHEGDLEWYTDTVHPTFLQVKENLYDLIELNNSALYSTSAHLQAKAERAVLPGILAIISALILTALFNYMIHFSLVSPILNIIKGIRKFRERGEFKVEIHTRDEVRTLAEEIRALTVKLSPPRH